MSMLPSSRRTAEAVGSLGGIGFLVVVGLVTGMDVWTVESLPSPLIFFEGMVSVVIFTGIILITGAMVVKDAWTSGEADPVYSGPEVRAVVPAYRDSEVLDVSVGSLLKSEYENVSVAVVVEPDDPETRRKARELADEHDAVDCLVNADPGSKGTGINHAVSESEADYFAVFDVDEEVSPEFLPTAMGELLNGADVFQGRRVPRATGAVETLAYCERLIVHAGYVFGELFSFTNCLSSSTAFRREAFETVGGYEDKLTEDIEFAHACYRAELNVVHNRNATNTMEAPHTLRDFWGQRKRWRIGHVQVFQSRVREALKGGVRLNDIGSVGRASAAMVGGALLLVALSQILALTVRGVFSASLIPFGVTFAFVGAVWTRDAVDGRIGKPSPSIVFLPVIYLGHGALTVKSFLEYYLTWEGEWYQVTKTKS
jgi:biofilm PGA synthesis N-glycosyltransferase PgaC